MEKQRKSMSTIFAKTQLVGPYPMAFTISDTTWDT